MRTPLIRTAAGLGVCAAALAPAGALAGAASADTGRQPLAIEQTLFTGDPWPVSYQTYSVSTAAPGTARVTVDRQCNSFNRGLCLHYTRGGSIFWLNTADGRTGRAAIADGADPGSSTLIRTGRGAVLFTITSGGAPTTLVPAGGVATVG
ncbi:hypothetical protein [Gordonia sp. VNK21]|uniref:hypothetical protein n=1 Tax=Gordonia sp. VNK21 TaxID=3382483 RepID=UPI0038D3A492